MLIGKTTVFRVIRKESGRDMTVFTILTCKMSGRDVTVTSEMEIIIVS